jgi:ABC-2 type transport system permease protein
MMRRIQSVARREIRSYFDQPTAYILIVAFLGLALFLAFRQIYLNKIATLRPLFDLFPWLMAMFVPAITMRSLAEERRNRTLEWLLAQPLRERDVVVGKFLGDWLFLLVAIAGTLPLALGLLLLSDADPGMMLAQYFGAALLGAHYVAMGLWASSLTRNQITAFILAAMLSFIFVLIGLPVVTLGLPPAIGGTLARLSVLSHFDNVARGVIDLRDVLYFSSMAGLFLVLAGFALSRERLSRERGAYRRLRLGAAVTAAGVILLNLLGGYVRGRLDLTREKVYTLSAGTRSLVSGLKDILQIKLFVSSELPPEVQLLLRDVRDLLADMQRASNGNLRVVEANPDAKDEVRQEAQTLGIVPTEFNVFRDNEFQVKRGWFGLALLYANERRVIPSIDRTDDLEFRLASFINSMTAPSKPTIMFLSGFGAKNIFEYRLLGDALGERYQTRYLDLERDSTSRIAPDSVKVVFFAAPSQVLPSHALSRLREYVQGGGSAFLLVENATISPQFPVASATIGALDPLLEEWGVVRKNGIVFDLRSHANVTVGRTGIFSVVSGYPLWPIVGKGSVEHPTVRNLQNLSLAWATAFAIKDSVHVVPLWRTTDAAGLRSVDLPIEPNFFSADVADERGAQIVAVAVDPGLTPKGGKKASRNSNGAEDNHGGGHRGRLVVVGDADFLADQFVRSNPQNLIFAANALDWLAQDEILIRIRSKHRTPPILAFKSQLMGNLLKWGNLVGVPLLFAVVGLVRISGRSRRAMRRWATGTEGFAPAEASGGKVDGTVSATQEANIARGGSSDE